MKRRHLTDVQKVLMVLAGTGEGVKIADLCRKHGIARSSFYSWRKNVLANLTSGLASKKSRRGS